MQDRLKRLKITKIKENNEISKEKKQKGKNIVSERERKTNVKKKKEIARH